MEMMRIMMAFAKKQKTGDSWREAGYTLDRSAITGLTVQTHVYTCGKL